MRILAKWYICTYIRKYQLKLSKVFLYCINGNNTKIPIFHVKNDRSKGKKQLKTFKKINASSGIRTHTLSEHAIFSPTPYPLGHSGQVLKVLYFQLINLIKKISSVYRRARLVYLVSFFQKDMYKHKAESRKKIMPQGRFEPALFSNIIFSVRRLIR